MLQCGDLRRHRVEFGVEGELVGLQSVKSILGRFVGLFDGDGDGSVVLTDAVPDAFGSVAAYAAVQAVFEVAVELSVDDRGDVGIDSLGGELIDRSLHFRRDLV